LDEALVKVNGKFPGLSASASLKPAAMAGLGGGHGEIPGRQH